MKLKHMFITLGLALGLGVGVAAGIGGTRQMKAARAANPAGATLYLDVRNASGESWHQGNERYAVYYYGTGDGWADLVAVEGEAADTYYSVTIPAGTWTNVIFCRMDGSKDDNKWDNKWLQTDDLTYDGAKNLYKIDNGNDGTGHATGAWDTYAAPVNNATVFFVDGGAWHDDGEATPSAYAWNGTYSTAYPGTALALTDSRLKVGENWYCVMSATLSGTARNIQFNNGRSGKDEQKTGDLDLVDGGVYFYGVDGKFTSVVNLLKLVESQMGAKTIKGKEYAKSICAIGQVKAKEIVDAYDVLVDAEKTADADVRAAAANSALYTYDKDNSYALGTNVSLASIRAQLVENYPAIVASSELLTRSNNTDSTVIIIVAVSVATVLVIAGFYFYRRRKLQ